MAWSCEAFNDFLLDRAPHFDDEVLRDWRPTDDAWVGHVATIPWDAFTGTTHVYDRVHIAAPDLSQAWDPVNLQEEGCIDNACTNKAVCIGWGMTRKDYSLEQITYQTNVLCFDEIDTKAKANAIMGEILKGIKRIAKEVWSDFHRRNSLMLNTTLYICGATMTTLPVTAGMFTGAMATIDLGAVGNLPTSNLSTQWLQRQYAPIMGNGYFNGESVPNGIIKLITDPITSNQLIEQNPTLTGMYQFSDFQAAGKLFKYGMSTAIGNYGISFDMFPARFYHIGNGVLQRVWPYTNVAATIGIQPQWNTQYELAPYQYSCIWHPEAMRRAVPKLEPIAGMPFLTRDLGGAWNFTGGNRDRYFSWTDPTTGETCAVDNRKGNKGGFWADFRGGFKFENPQWTRAILHLREPGCVHDNVPCTTPPDYVVQDYGACNPVCED